MVFKEAVRLNPPVPTLPRLAVREFFFMGHTIPARTRIGVSPLVTHRLPDIWPDPDNFNPLRFTPENSRSRHKYAWVPFGGGKHMCIGLHFAQMQVKACLFSLLSQRRLVLPSRREVSFQMFPIPKPRDGLPTRLERL